MDSPKVHQGGEDEMVWNLIEYRKFDVHSYYRASRVSIGAMFMWSPKLSSNVSLCKIAALGKILSHKEYPQ